MREPIVTWRDKGKTRLSLLGSGLFVLGCNAAIFYAIYLLVTSW